MAKKNDTTATTTATATTEAVQDTAETKTKAPAGSSIQAQAKAIVAAVSRELKEGGAILTDTLEWLHKVAAEIGDGATRGLPAAERLELAQNERNALYVGGKVVDGKFTFATPEDAHRVDQLTAKILRIEREIKEGGPNRGKRKDEKVDGATA